MPALRKTPSSLAFVGLLFVAGAAAMRRKEFRYTPFAAENNISQLAANDRWLYAPDPSRNASDAGNIESRRVAAELSENRVDGAPTRRECYAKCGLSFFFKSAAPENRIIGGHPVPLGSKRSLALLRIRVPNCGGFGFTCTGTILEGQHWVMTAAHCFYYDVVKDCRRDVELDASGNPVPSLRRVQTTAISISTRAGAVFEVEEMKVPERYAVPQTRNQNDIALLKLKGAIEWSAAVGPDCLPPRSLTEPVSGTMLSVAGYGDYNDENTGELKAPGAEPREVQVPSINRVKCMSDFGLQDPHMHIMCAGGYRRDSYLGDSGGPLHQTHNVNREVLIGIVSAGGVAATGSPPMVDEVDGNYIGHYTRVAPFCPWIKEMTAGEVTCPSSVAVYGYETGCWNIIEPEEK